MSRIKVTNLRHESATSDNISLTSTARVGIGTSSPAVVVEAQAAQAELQLKSTSGTNSAGLRFVPGGETNALYIYADGSRNINIDNHATSIASFRASGGLTFNGDTAAANALDDYEEGTFTPTINTGYTVSYDGQSGRYIKIGKQVAVWIYIDTNTISGSSSDTYAEVEGLPFTIRSSNIIDTAFTVGWQFNLSNSVDHAYGQQNGTHIVLLGPNSSGTRTHWSPVNVWNNNDTRLCLTGVYWTDQ